MLQEIEGILKLMAKGPMSTEHRAKISAAKMVHGMSRTPTHVSWAMMRQRCENLKAKNYDRYGGRGISICTRWTEPKPQGFLNFLEDMGLRPNGTSLDRVDSNGNYEPGNCRWATSGEQANNHRHCPTCSC